MWFADSTCTKAKPRTTEYAEDAEEILDDASALILYVPCVRSGCLPHQHAAVHVHHVSGNVGSLFRGQKSHRIGDIFRRADPRQRNHLQGVLLEVVPQAG